MRRGAQRQRPVSPTATAVETFEIRQYPAATMTATFTAGVLNIEGTTKADTITVQQTGDQLAVRNGTTVLQIKVGAAGVSQVSASQVQLIKINSLGGNDTLRLDGVSVAANINGDDGVDNITGGSGDDILNGSTNDDMLNGGEGNDSLAGDAGNDSLSGENGQDTLLGGDDNDFADGGLGQDLIYGDDGHDELRGGDGEDTLAGGVDRDTLWIAPAFQEMSIFTLWRRRVDTIHRLGDAGADP